MAMLSCACRNRFEAPDAPTGQATGCPACDRSHGAPVVSSYYPMSSLKYFQAAQNAPVDPTGSRPTIPCEACAGTGICRMCGGKKDKARKNQITDHLLFRLYYGQAFEILKILLGVADDHGSKCCLDCSGNGKCFTCRGLGVADS